MKFYCIVDDVNNLPNPRTYQFLQEACSQRNIEMITLEARDFDFSQDTTTLIPKGSALYRLSAAKRAILLEALLLQEGVISFHRPINSSRLEAEGWGDAILFQKAGLPLIPTIFGVSRAHTELLESYVAALGGFPVILKASGGSHGASVMRIDSLESLRSVVGFVSDEQSAEFVLRRYIENAQHIRCVVIGDKVVDAIRYLPQPGDFRTNAVAEPQVEAFARTPDTEYIFATAEAAVKARANEFGGVDILVDGDNNAFIAEVNSPCNFARNQMTTGADIAGMMIDRLLIKAEQDRQ